MIIAVTTTNIYIPHCLHSLRELFFLSFQCCFSMNSIPSTSVLRSHPYYIRQASRLQVKQIYVASRAKHAKIRQNVSSFKTLVGINLLPLYSPQGIFPLELWSPKKTSQWLRSFAPAYHRHHPRTDSVVPHPKSSTNGTVRAKKEMNTVVFWNTTRHSSCTQELWHKCNSKSFRILYV